jgi:DNA-binding MarR family transcriptional regulator
VRSIVTKAALMPGGSDARFRRFIHDFLAFSGQVEQVRDGFGAHVGLSGTAYILLMSLRHIQDGEGVGVNRLAEHLRLSGAFVTTEVAKLVEAGFVAKQPHPRDRRRVLLTVTPQGRERLEQLVPVQAKVNDLMFGAFEEAEFLHFAAMVERLVKSGREAVTLLNQLREAGTPVPLTRDPLRPPPDAPSPDPG